MPETERGFMNFLQITNFVHTERLSLSVSAFSAKAQDRRRRA